MSYLENYIGQSPDEVISRENMTVPTIRRASADIGIALIAIVIAEFIGQILGSFLLSALISGFKIENYDAVYFLLFFINCLVAYVPSLIILRVVYKKYKGYEKVFCVYSHRGIEFPLFLLAIFAFGIWGTKVTDFFNYLFMIWFDAPVIPSVMDNIAPLSFMAGIINIINVALVAPVAEEFIYRKLLLNPLRVLGDVPAIILSSLVFGLSHGNFDQFLYCFFSGIIFAVVTVRTGKIKWSVALHLINNLTSCISTYRSIFTTGNPLWDTAVAMYIAFFNYVTTIAYIGGPLIIIVMIMLKLFHFESIRGEDKYKKLFACISLPMIAALVIMFADFFI